LKTTSPFQPTQFVKAFSVIFIGLTILLALITSISPTTIQAIKILLLLNLVISVVGGYFYYKNRYHTTFSYDKDGFALVEGKEERRALWKEFDAVSLVQRGYGDFSVRVYRGKDYLDIPASALRLDASSLRFEVMEYIKKEEKNE